jgi:recombination protein U
MKIDKLVEKKVEKKTFSFTMKNRGMLFESLINETIQKLEVKGMAYFKKRYTPIKIDKKVGDEYRAYFYSKAAIDYYGCYRGRFFAFEAKEVGGEKFPLSNLREEQFNEMKTIASLGGNVFLLIYFSRKNAIFLLKYDELFDLFSMKKSSVKFDYATERYLRVRLSTKGPINLLEAISESFPS